MDQSRISSLAGASDKEKKQTGQYQFGDITKGFIQKFRANHDTSKLPYREEKDSS